MIELKTGDIIEYSLVTDTVLGGKRSGFVVSSGDMDFRLASKLYPEIVQLHKNLFPYFKDKVDNVDDPSKYSYFVATGPNGKEEVIGKPWVIDTSLQIVTSKQVTYVLNAFKESQRATIETMFRNLGINFTSSEKIT